LPGKIVVNAGGSGEVRNFKPAIYFRYSKSGPDIGVSMRVIVFYVYSYFVWTNGFRQLYISQLYA
jgi:hypothetical protein